MILVNAIRFNTYEIMKMNEEIFFFIVVVVVFRTRLSILCEGEEKQIEKRERERWKQVGIVCIEHYYIYLAMLITYGWHSRVHKSTSPVAIKISDVIFLSIS